MLTGNHQPETYIIRDVLNYFFLLVSFWLYKRNTKIWGPMLPMPPLTLPRIKPKITIKNSWQFGIDRGRQGWRCRRWESAKKSVKNVWMWLKIRGREDTDYGYIWKAEVLARKVLFWGPIVGTVPVAKYLEVWHGRKRSFSLSLEEVLKQIERALSFKRTLSQSREMRNWVT